MGYHVKQISVDFLHDVLKRTWEDITYKYTKTNSFNMFINNEILTVQKQG